MLSNDIYGQDAIIPIRIMSVEQAGDVLRVEAEELRYKFDPDEINATRYVYISNDQNDVNLRTLHDAEYPGSPPIATTDIIFVVEAGVVVGGSDPTQRAIDVGDWSGLTYNSLTLEYETGSTNSGAGGAGGKGAGNASGAATDGEDGGTALYTRTAITVTNNGTVQGGGGGGGGGSIGFAGEPGSGGGGGAGRVVGIGGVGGQSNLAGGPASGQDGANGTLSTGGAGGTSFADGGNGGGPATAGAAGESTGGAAGAGGAAGVAVDGKSFVNGGAGITTGTVTGTQIN